MMITWFPCLSSQFRSAASWVLAAGASAAYSSRTMHLFLLQDPAALPEFEAFLQAPSS
jgi:hypothetical protein